MFGQPRCSARSRSGLSAHHLAANSHILDRLPDLTLILWVHDDDELWWVLHEIVGTNNPLPHERHKVTLLARVYIDHPIDAGAGANPQQVQEHNAFGARAPEHDFSVTGPEAIDALAPFSNFLDKSCAKRAVKGIRRPIWRTTGRRLASNSRFYPQLLIIKARF